jgi:hypothetical protein
MFVTRSRKLRVIAAIVGAGVAILTLTAGSTPAQRALEAARDTEAVRPTAPVLSTGADLRFTRNIDVSERKDVFSRVSRFSSDVSVAELDDGTYISWQYRSAAGPTGVYRPTALGKVTAGPTLASVGIQTPAVLPKTPPPPPAAACDLLDARDLKQPGAPLPYVAACRTGAMREQTKLIAYNSAGQVKEIGVHPLRVQRVSTEFGLHGGGGSITLLTAPDTNGHSYLQLYTWRTQ